MEKISQIKVIIMIITISFNLITGISSEKLTDAHLESGLGLVIPWKTIKVIKEVVNAEIELMIFTNFSKATAIESTRTIVADLDSLAQRPFLKSGAYTMEYGSEIKIIKTYVLDIVRSMTEMKTYEDPKTEIQLENHCQVIYHIPGPGIIDQLAHEVKVVIETIPVGTTEAQFHDNKTMQLEFIKAMTIIANAIHEAHIDYKLRIDMITALSTGKVMTDIITHMESLSCIEAGEMEEVRVHDCKKTNMGFYCQLALNIHKSVNEYTSYYSIHYEGVAWIPENTKQVLLKNLQGGWELMECDTEIDNDYSDNILEDLFDCATKNYENSCSEKLEGEDFDGIIRYCNFSTKRNMQEIVRTTRGILFTGDKVKVKELGPINKNLLAILPEKRPLHITTSAILQTTLKGKEVTIRPASSNVTRKLTFTKFTDEFIQRMKNSAQQSELLKDYLDDYIEDTIYAAILLLLTPITLLLCLAKVKETSLRDWLSIGKQISSNKVNRKENFQRNKRILQKTKI
jgi:hypothetical protein